MTGPLHSAGFIQSGKMLCLIVSITCQASNCLLETARPQRTGTFCSKDGIFLWQLQGGDLFWRQHIERGHHLDKDPLGFKEAIC